MTKYKKFVVLHEYGAPEHYRGLEQYAEQACIEIKYIEFSIFLNSLRAIKRRSPALLMRQVRNFFQLIWLIFKPRKEALVIGIAPLNWAFIMLVPLFWGRQVSIHSSWPYWDGSKFPHKDRWGLFSKMWTCILTKYIHNMIFVTKHAAKSFEASEFNSIPTYVVGHCYNPDIYYPVKETCPSEKPLEIGYCGRLESSKGIDTFLNLSNVLKSSDFNFNIAGSGSWEANILSACKEDKRIQYYGFIKGQAKMADFFRGLDILLLPSRRTANWEELFGMVIIEAMACGVVVLSTDHPGPSEILDSMPDVLFSEEDFFDGTVAFIEGKTNKKNVSKLAGLYNLNSAKQKWQQALN